MRARARRIRCSAARALHARRESCQARHRERAAVCNRDGSPCASGPGIETATGRPSTEPDEKTRIRDALRERDVRSSVHGHPVEPRLHLLRRAVKAVEQHLAPELNSVRISRSRTSSRTATARCSRFLRQPLQRCLGDLGLGRSEHPLKRRRRSRSLVASASRMQQAVVSRTRVAT